MDVLVAKGGSHAIVYEDKATGEREVVTDPKAKFDEDNLGASPRKLVGGKGVATLVDEGGTGGKSGKLVGGRGKVFRQE